MYAIRSYYADGTIVVYGYTDRIGSEQYNQALSEKRAQTVADYFVQKGIPADKVSASYNFV